MTSGYITTQVGGVTVTVPDAPAVDLPLTVADFDAGLMRHYDAVAKSKHYDSRVTCALRAGYTGPFQAEGVAFAQWMDACNVYAYTQLAAWQSGGRAAPESVDAFIAELPPITWPE